MREESIFFHSSGHILAIIALVISCLAITGKIDFKKDSIKAKDIKKNTFYSEGMNIKVADVVADGDLDISGYSSMQGLTVTGNSDIKGSLNSSGTTTVEDLTVTETLRDYKLAVLKNPTAFGGGNLSPTVSGTIFTCNMTSNGTINLPVVEKGFRLTFICTQTSSSPFSTISNTFNCNGTNKFAIGSYISSGNSGASPPSLQPQNPVNVIQTQTLTISDGRNFGKGARIDFVGISDTEWLVSGYGGISPNLFIAAAVVWS